MAKPIQPLLTGSLLMKVGEEILIRGEPNILFRFETSDGPFELIDNTLVAIIIRNGPPRALSNVSRFDNLELRYVVLPRGAGDIFDVTYTLIDALQA